jgi:hypothetical protein
MNFTSRLRVAIAIGTFVGASGTALADHAPSLVVPGRADYPVMVNGYDASWGVVEGDWGLHRPGFVSPTVIPSPIAAPLAPAKHFFPSLGAAPYSGRYEIEPPANRALPPPAQSFHRDWSTSSDMSVPATAPSAYPEVIPGPGASEQDYQEHQRGLLPRHQRGLLPRHQRGLLPRHHH